MWHVPLIFTPPSLLKIAILSTTWQWTPWKLSIRNIWEWPGRLGSKSVTEFLWTWNRSSSCVETGLIKSCIGGTCRPTRTFQGCSSAVTFGAQNKHFSSGKADLEKKNQTRDNKMVYAIQSGAFVGFLLFLTVFKNKQAWGKNHAQGFSKDERLENSPSDLG